MLDDMADQRNALSNVEKQMAAVSEKIDQLVRVKMKTFEEKLNRIEATMVSTGRDFCLSGWLLSYMRCLVGQNVKQVSSGIKSLPGVMKKIAELQQQTVVYAVSTEFRCPYDHVGAHSIMAITGVCSKNGALRSCNP